MIELNVEALTAVRDLLKVTLDQEERRQERRRRMAPLREAMRKQIGFTQELVPDLMASTTANARLSVLALEKSSEEFSSKRHEAQALSSAALDAARRRTSQLQKLLEQLR